MVCLFQNCFCFGIYCENWVGAAVLKFCTENRPYLGKSLPKTAAPPCLLIVILISHSSCHGYRHCRYCNHSWHFPDLPNSSYLSGLRKMSMSGRMDSDPSCLFFPLTASAASGSCLFFLPLDGAEVATQDCWSGLKEAPATQTHKLGSLFVIGPWIWKLFLC